MKKSIIAVAVLILLAALLPILGNTFIKQTIDDRIAELKTVGLETKKDEIDSSYLTTSRHMEFTLKDSQKFIAYLSTFADKQPPAYINAMFNGVVLGVDIEYSNLPFAKAFEVEIFPLTLSDDIRESLKQNDADFLTYLQKFLQSKGIVYHINYNIIDKSFDGYIKDIKQKYTLKDGAKIDVELSQAVFNGEGTLVAPDMIDSKIKAFHLNVIQKAQTFDMALEKFSSSINFDSKSTYVSAMAVDKVDMVLRGTDNDADIHAKKLKFNASSNTQGKNAELDSKASFEQVSMASKDLNVTLEKFDFDIAANKIDKESYIKLTQLLSNEKNQVAPLANKEIQKTLVTLFSKGFVIKIAKLGLEDITLDGQTDLHGFDFKSELTFAADKDLAQKIKLSPMMAGSDLEFNSTLKVAVELYTFLTTKSPMLGSIKHYAKEENGSYVFELKVKDAKATVNGKALN